MKTKRQNSCLRLLTLVGAMFGTLAGTGALVSCASDEALFAEYDMLCRSQMCLAPMAEVMYQVDAASVDWEPAVYFGYDLSTLDLQQQASLNTNVSLLLDHPELRVNLQAFTDTNNTVSYNIALSDRRRVTVENYLKQKGIDESRIVSSVAGEMLPIHAGSSIEEQAINRRVELMLLDTAGVPLSFSVTLPDGGQSDFVPPYPDRKIQE